MAGFWNGVHWGMGFKKASEGKAKRCVKCGRRISAGYRYCPHCGAPQKEVEDVGP
ncbi:MAG: zinc-ribbon domain-containing protein [Candidatus Bathyarchaeia archaeon]